MYPFFMTIANGCISESMILIGLTTPPKNPLTQGMWFVIFAGLTLASGHNTQDTQTLTLLETFA